MIYRSSSEYSAKPHFLVKRVMEAQPLSHYTTHRVRKTVWDQEKTFAVTCAFLPFCRERDGVGRLLSPQESIKTRVVRRENRETGLSRDKKLKRSIRLLTKKDPVAPAVGTYITTNSWVKKSFWSPPGHRKVLSLQNSPNAGPIESLQCSQTVSAVSSPIKLRKNQKQRVKEDHSKLRNDFGTLKLQGLPSELGENQSLRNLYALRAQAMTRFKAVSKRVMRRFRSSFHAT